VKEQAATLNAPAARANEPLLSVRQLSTCFEDGAAKTAALDAVSFDIPRGSIVALVGDSGSGKSVTALSILGLLPPAARVTGGQVLFQGRDLLAAGEAERRRLRGRGIGMIFQEPASALSPVHSVGWQLALALRTGGKLGPIGALQRTSRVGRGPARELLARVELPEPERLLDLYPHQLSAGMRRRVMIALALAQSPALLIADEPTTGLDAPIQAQILDLLLRLVSEPRQGESTQPSEATQPSVLFITHVLCVAAEVASEIVVLYGGQVVEAGPVRSVLGRPQHPYTIGLLEHIPGHGFASPPSSSRAGLDTAPRFNRGPGPGAGAEPGCRFAERCPQWQSDPERFLRCSAETPQLEPAAARHRSRCFYPRLAGE
jgi:oligopeptide/dipeptide ABC transporter ATP-binding protein